MLEELVRGIITGIFMGFVILYSLRPKTPYPSFMLLSFEHPWVFIVLAIVVIYLFVWDRVVGCLGFIILLCLVLDFHMFSKKPIEIKEFQHENIQYPMLLDDKYRSVAIHDISGQPLDSIGIDSDHYPLFSDTEVEMRPGYPSPY